MKEGQWREPNSEIFYLYTFIICGYSLYLNVFDLFNNVILDLQIFLKLQIIIWFLQKYVCNVCPNFNLRIENSLPPMFYVNFRNNFLYHRRFFILYNYFLYDIFIILVFIKLKF